MQYLRRDTYAFTEKRNHVLYRGWSVCDGRKPECSASAKVCILLSENSLLAVSASVVGRLNEVIGTFRLIGREHDERRLTMRVNVLNCPC